VKRLVKVILNTLFYGCAVIIDAPYRVVNGDYYVVMLVVLVASLDIIILLQYKHLKEIDKFTESIEKELIKLPEKI